MKQLRKLVALVIALMCMATLIATPLAYAQETTTPPPFVGILKVGDENDEVLALQKKLTELGYFKGSETGQYDVETAEAVRDFQSANGITADGTCGQKTWELLFSGNAIAATAEWVAWDFEAGAMADNAQSYSYAAAPMAGGYSMGKTAGVNFNTNEYSTFAENSFMSVNSDPFSTFAADVDTAAYALLRSQILAGNAIPAASVRTEEMLNYFRYNYAQPKADEPMGVIMEMMDTPWNKDTKLLLIGLQAEEIPHEERAAQNLVFLIDVSGSMNSADKLPLVKRAFLLLLDELEPTDTISIVTYASRDEVVLDGGKAEDKVQIMAAIDSLQAGGATAGADGIRTAYELAKKHYIKDGVNRVILATDGDLNVGISSEGELTTLIEEKKQSGVFLSVLGFGFGNLKDNKMEALADHGNGNYSYIDTIYEARKALVEEIGATFQTVAKDVKLQVEFNPGKVKGYRLIGYENRLMASTDFADDTKDGGELGSGHRVTVLYEVVPVDSAFAITEVEKKYDSAAKTETGDEWLTLNLRAKEPNGEESKLYTYPLTEAALTDTPSDNLLFAAAVAQTGMLLSQSEWKGTATYASTLELLRKCAAVQGDVYKEEFVYLLTLLERQ